MSLFRNFKVPKESRRGANEFLENLGSMRLFRPDGNPDPGWIFVPRGIGAGTLLDRSESDTRAMAAIKAIDLAGKNYGRTQQIKEMALKAAEKAELAAPGNQKFRFDVSLMARALIVKDLIAPAHLDYIRRRMRVWEKGYVLEGFVGGHIAVSPRSIHGIDIRI